MTARVRLYVAVEIVVNDPKIGRPWAESGWLQKRIEAIRAAAKDDHAVLEVEVKLEDVGAEP